MKEIYYNMFCKGDKVQLSDYGMKYFGLKNRSNFGTVAHQPNIHAKKIAVRFDGQKSASYYHVDYWEKREQEI